MFAGAGGEGGGVDEVVLAVVEQADAEGAEAGGCGCCALFRIVC